MTEQEILDLKKAIQKRVESKLWGFYAQKATQDVVAEMKAVLDNELRLMVFESSDDVLLSLEFFVVYRLPGVWAELVVKPNLSDYDHKRAVLFLNNEAFI